MAEAHEWLVVLTEGCDRDGVRGGVEHSTFNRIVAEDKEPSGFINRRNG